MLLHPVIMLTRRSKLADLFEELSENQNILQCHTLRDTAMASDPAEVESRVRLLLAYELQ